MNDELKDALRTQGEKVRNATRRYEAGKVALDRVKGAIRGAVRESRASANLKPLNEADTDAMVAADSTKTPIEDALVEAKADLEAVKADGECLLAHVSLVCSETAAMSRISQ